MTLVPLAVCAMSVGLISSIVRCRLDADQSRLVNRRPHLSLQRAHAIYEAPRW
jgi:hypothetical protein